MEPRTEGTPQGGPLSPLLSNILLDDLDKELERRGHRFCRYADDCNIYVGSQRAGERVMASLTRFLAGATQADGQSEEKCGGPALEAEVSGLFPDGATGIAGSEWLPKSVERFKDKLRQKFREGRGRNLRAFIASLKPLLQGWASYYQHGGNPASI